MSLSKRTLLAIGVASVCIGAATWAVAQSPWQDFALDAGYQR